MSIYEILMHVLFCLVLGFMAFNEWRRYKEINKINKEVKEPSLEEWKKQLEINWNIAVKTFMSLSKSEQESLHLNPIELNKVGDGYWDEENQILYKWDGSWWNESKDTWPDGKGFECSLNFGKIKAEFDPGNFGDEKK